MQQHREAGRGVRARASCSEKGGELGGWRECGLRRGMLNTPPLPRERHGPGHMWGWRGAGMGRERIRERQREPDAERGREREREG